MVKYRPVPWLPAGSKAALSSQRLFETEQNRKYTWSWNRKCRKWNGRMPGHVIKGENELGVELVLHFYWARSQETHISAPASLSLWTPLPHPVCVVSWSLFSLNSPSTDIRCGLLETQCILAALNVRLRSSPTRAHLICHSFCLPSVLRLALKELPLSTAPSNNSRQSEPLFTAAEMLPYNVSYPTHTVPWWWEHVGKPPQSLS